MSEQDLNNSDVHALFKHVRGEAVAERVRPELVVEAALVSRFVERVACGGVGQVCDDAATWEQPSSAAANLPDLSKHVENRLGQRKGSLFVPFADHTQNHLLRVDRRDGQSDRLADPQAVGVDQGEASAIDGLSEPGDQAAAIRVATNVRQPFLTRLADFFLSTTAIRSPVC